MDDSLGDFPNGAVLVEDGIIQAVGKAEDIAATDAETINTEGGVVMPGMVDSHRHTSLSLMRGFAADQSLLQFLLDSYTKYLPAISPEDAYTSALVGALEALDSGVTTILEPEEGCQSRQHAEASLKGLEDSGIRGFFCFGMNDAEYSGAKTGRDAHKARLAHLNELHKINLSSGDKLVRVGLSISHPGTVPFDLTGEEIRFAQDRGMLCCSHSACLKSSVMLKGIVERADNGLMLPGHVYIHCTNLNPKEIKLIADSGGKISIAPETEMQMGMGIPPFRQCIDHGVKVSISQDISAAAPPSLLAQMRLGLQLQRCLDNEAMHDKRKVPLHLDLTVRDALIWGTRNGADALNLADQIGTLTPGKRADVVFISDKRALAPSMNPLATTLLCSSPADVDTVMIDGKIRKRNGQLVGYDLEKIRANAKQAVKRISDALANLPPGMTQEELKGYLLESERSTRSNFARAYNDENARGDWHRRN